MATLKLFRAHMLLLRWGREALGEMTGDAGKLAGVTTSPACDGSEERAGDSVPRATYLNSGNE